MDKLLRTLETRGFAPKTLATDDIQTENYCSNALLLWLYIVAKNPFDLMKFDEDQTSNLTMKRIVNVTQDFLKSSLTAVRFSAALILSHVVTRSDGVDKLLAPTISMCIQRIQNDLTTDFMDQNELCGRLILLSAILKSAQRTDVVVYAPKMFEAIQQFAELKSSNNVVNHLVAKLYQRIGLLYLKPKVAKWRYSRGYRSIADNLSASQPVQSSSVKASPMEKAIWRRSSTCF
uniref:Tubulin-specific chaperone D n=1 Tax=Steinernema glaseri TaxID=37863 RepID=A0A1I7ZMN7_9BILA